MADASTENYILSPIILPNYSRAGRPGRRGLTSRPSSLARTIRLMAGHELAAEGFRKGQVGSSAMPHKINSRSSERINGFHAILNGYLNMAIALAGVRLARLGVLGARVPDGNRALERASVHIDETGSIPLGVRTDKLMLSSF